MILIEEINVWWQRRRQDRLMRARYLEWASDPPRYTRSPWIRGMIESPMWNEKVRLKSTPRIIEVTDATKATGRDFVLDLLRLEFCVRFRHRRWAWEGIFAAMGDDVLEALYTEERERIYCELLKTCPDETLCPGCCRSLGAVTSMIGGYVRAATKSIHAGRST